MALASSTTWSLRLSKRCSDREKVKARRRARRLRVAVSVRWMCAREGSSVRFLDADADAIADLERGHGGKQQDAGDQADVDVVHELLHGTLVSRVRLRKGRGRRRLPRSRARSEGSGQVTAGSPSSRP